jgi:hypothetical protein
MIVRRGFAEHSTGPFTCWFALLRIQRARVLSTRNQRAGRYFSDPPGVPVARLERAAYCSGGSRSIHAELHGLEPNHTEVPSGPVDDEQ